MRHGESDVLLEEVKGEGEGGRRPTVGSDVGVVEC